MDDGEPHEHAGEGVADACEVAEEAEQDEEPHEDACEDVDDAQEVAEEAEVDDGEPQ